MLTEKQKVGIQDLCVFLEPEVVKSVAETATKRKLAITSAPEAIDALILHSDSALWLLNRKKLTRALLFEYLHAKKVPISGKAEKIEIINKILEYWDSTPISNNLIRQDKQATGVSHDTATLVRHEPVSQLETAFQNTQQIVELPQGPKMGIEFAKWFYEILLGVLKQTVPGEQIAHQFWKDARLRITLNSNNASDFQESIGDKEAAELLGVLLCQHTCLFNPNLSNEGVREKTSAHGLVMVVVCGTVHQNGNCTGIFEQAFGLIQDPTADFVWRIKWSDLRITQAAVSRAPCISDLPELMAICDGQVS